MPEKHVLQGDSIPDFYETRSAEEFFPNMYARFRGGGIMLYVAPLLDLDLNYSLQSIICWMR